MLHLKGKLPQIHKITASLSLLFIKHREAVGGHSGGLVFLGHSFLSNRPTNTHMCRCQSTHISAPLPSAFTVILLLTRLMPCSWTNPPAKKTHLDLLGQILGKNSRLLSVFSLHNAYFRFQTLRSIDCIHSLLNKIHTGVFGSAKK